MDVVKLCNSLQNKVRLTSIEDHDPQALHTPAKGLSLCLLFCGEIAEKDGCLPVTTNFPDSILVYSFFSDVNISIISLPLDTGVGTWLQSDSIRWDRHHLLLSFTVLLSQNNFIVFLSPLAF